MCDYEWSPRSSARFESARPTLRRHFASVRIVNGVGPAPRGRRGNRRFSTMGDPASARLSFFSSRSRFPVAVTLVTDTDVVLQRKEVSMLKLEITRKRERRKREIESAGLRCRVRAEFVVSPSLGRLPKISTKLSEEIFELVKRITFIHGEGFFITTFFTRARAFYWILFPDALFILTQECLIITRQC